MWRRDKLREVVPSVSVDANQYARDFCFSEFDEATDKSDTLLARALAQAFEARKFEIEMYWKRATYFWAFIAASFVGFAAFFNGLHGFAALLMANVGLLFSLAWHLVNRGSKAWQENWENHVELLEDKVIGPLYKTSARRPESASQSEGVFERLLTSPLSLSVSKLNTLTSAYVVLVWCALLIVAAGSLWRSDVSSWISEQAELLRCLVIGGSVVTTGVFVALLFLEGKTHMDGHNPVLSKRRVSILTESNNAANEANKKGNKGDVAN